MRDPVSRTVLLFAISGFVAGACSEWRFPALLLLGEGLALAIALHISLWVAGHEQWIAFKPRIMRLVVAYAILTVAYPFALNVAVERAFRTEGLLLASGSAALLAWLAFSILTRHADQVVLALLAGSALIVVGLLEAAVRWRAVEFTLPLAIGLALFNVSFALGLLRAETRAPHVARTAGLPGRF